MRTVIVALIGCLAVIGCKEPQGELPRPDLSNRKAKVLATTGMIADAAREIGGDHVEVDCLMGPGIDPHLYLATPKDLIRIDGADLVLFNGLHLEGKMTDVFEARAKRARTLGVAEDLPDLRQAEEGYDGTHDPHIWFDVTLWMKVCEKIRDALIDLDPAHADAYRERTRAYLETLTKLHQEVKSEAEKLPKDKRVLITAHDAFHYFGRAYGFEVKGLQGVSTASDTSGRDVQELADLIGTRQIKAVFAETSVSDKGMQAVQKAVRAKYKGFDVRLAEQQLYSDALGEPGSGADTYVAMVRHNVRAIVEALSQ